MLHLIPDDGQPHAPTTECGCDPQLGWHNGRRAIWHTDFSEEARTTVDNHDGQLVTRDHRIER